MTYRLSTMSWNARNRGEQHMVGLLAPGPIWSQRLPIRLRRTVTVRGYQPVTAARLRWIFTTFPAPRASQFARQYNLSPWAGKARS